jgi:hypothetical protein
MADFNDQWPFTRRGTPPSHVSSPRQTNDEEERTIIISTSSWGGDEEPVEDLALAGRRSIFPLLITTTTQNMQAQTIRCAFRFHLKRKLATCLSRTTFKVVRGQVTSRSFSCFTRPPHFFIAVTAYAIARSTNTCLDCIRRSLAFTVS